MRPQCKKTNIHSSRFHLCFNVKNGWFLEKNSLRIIMQFNENLFFSDFVSLSTVDRGASTFFFCCRLSFNRFAINVWRVKILNSRHKWPFLSRRVSHSREFYGRWKNVKFSFAAFFSKHVLWIISNSYKKKELQLQN